MKRIQGFLKAVRRYTGPEFFHNIKYYAVEITGIVLFLHLLLGVIRREVGF